MYGLMAAEMRDEEAKRRLANRARTVSINQFVSHSFGNLSIDQSNRTRIVC